MPIDVPPVVDGEPTNPTASPAVTVGTSSPVPAPSPTVTDLKIPTDEEIANLGGNGRDTYAKIADKILSQHKASDLGEMSTKLSELVSVSKGFNPNAVKHGLVDKALSIFRNEREQMLAHTQSVQHRINTMIGELDQIADRQRDRIRDMAALQQENLTYHESLKADVVQAKDWLAQVETALKAPVDQTDPAAAARGSALQHASQRLQVAINDFENAMTLAKQQAIEIQMTKDNVSAILDEFTKTKTLVIPALESILAQYLVGLEQKNAAAADSMLRDTLSDAMKENAQLTGNNAVEIATLQQQSMISVQTIEECQKLLEESASKIHEIEEAGRQQRIQDAAKRADVEQRMGSSVSR